MGVVLCRRGAPLVSKCELSTPRARGGWVASCWLGCRLALGMFDPRILQLGSLEGLLYTLCYAECFGLIAHVLAISPGTTLC